MKTKGYIYLSGILFTSYFWMQVSNAPGLINYSFWVIIHVILILPVLAYTSLSSRFKSKRRVLFSWLIAYLFSPILIFFVIKVIGNVINLDAWYGFNLLKRLDWILMETIGVSMIIHFLLYISERVSKRQDFIIGFKKISVFNMALLGNVLLSLMLPFISTDFQDFAHSNSLSRTIGIYLYSASQIFMIYGVFYLYYFLNHKILFRLVYTELGPIAYFISLLGLLFGLTPLVSYYISLFPAVYQLRIHPIGTGINLLDEVNYIFPIMVLIVSFPVILFSEWNRKNLELEILEKEKSKAELSLLKQQINPHFFFNTLNNLYALSLEKADETPEMILKLSQLMRYVIYKGKADYIKLDEEVAYIKDYLELQKLRIKQSVDIKFGIGQKPGDLVIPPLLLIILVENAFKHGIEPSEKSGFVHLNLEANDGSLTFSCVNSLDPDSLSEDHNGIGLNNLKKRLDLIYPDRYKLELKREKSKFFAKLELVL